MPRNTATPQDTHANKRRSARSASRSAAPATARSDARREPRPAVQAAQSAAAPAAAQASAAAFHTLSPEAIEHVAQYFQVLSEPARLRLLRILSDGERSVGELAELIGASAANTSRHLSQLDRHGFIVRETRGNSVICRIDDPIVFQLCDLVCESIVRRLDALHASRAAMLRTR